MKKGKSVTIKINFTNRWLYTLIVVGILAVIGVGVYALAPGVIPNPGHNVSEISVPSGCVAGQVLSYDGNKWVCANAYSSLNDLKAAVSNNFHNLGGRDEGFGGMYVKKISDGSCYIGNPYTSVPPAKSCTCPTLITTVRVVATVNILGVNYEWDYCDSSQSINGNF